MASSELWNVKDLKSPPKLTIKINIQEKDGTALRNLIWEAYSTFNNQTDFEKEAALLSRFIYCMKTKLRHNKGLKVTGKINQALLRYLRMNVASQMETFLGTLPRSFSTSTYMPSRNMLQYLLVRLQGVAKLMVRIVETSKIAAQTFEQLLSIGHMWKIYFLGYGIVSRIYALSRDIAKYCCRLYSHLLPFVSVLQNSIAEWLPNDYILPKDLQLWLNVDCLDDVHKQVAINEPFLSLFGYEAGDSDDELFADRSTTKQSALMESKSEVTAEDLGIPVLEEYDTKKQRKKKKESKCVAPKIRTLDDLKKFEKDFKNNLKKYSDDYKKLDKMQCSMLHKLLLKCVKQSTKHINNPVKVNGYLSEVKRALCIMFVVNCNCN